MCFYYKHICNFRTKYGIGLVQTANKGYWRHFVFFRVTYLPHAFFRRGPVFVLLIMKFFQHSASYNCCKSRFYTGNVPVSLDNGDHAI